jgi:hypothetical protein
VHEREERERERERILQATEAQRNIDRGKET